MMGAPSSTLMRRHQISRSILEMTQIVLVFPSAHPLIRQLFFLFFLGILSLIGRRAAVSYMYIVGSYWLCYLTDNDFRV